MTYNIQIMLLHLEEVLIVQECRQHSPGSKPSQCNHIGFIQRKYLQLCRIRCLLNFNNWTILRDIWEILKLVFSVAGGSPLYTLLIATKEAIYKVPVNNSVTPPIYGHETKLITGKLIRINNNNTVFLQRYFPHGKQRSVYVNYLYINLKHKH